MRDTATDTTETVAPGWPDNAMLEAAWGIIANAGGGNWETQTPEWQAAASRWREAYHRALAALLARPVEPAAEDWVPVRISREVATAMLVRDADGRRLTWDFGEPDADGMYTPTITTSEDDWFLARRAPGDREIVLTADDREAIVDALVAAGMLGTLERWRRALRADSRPEHETPKCATCGRPVDSPGWHAAALAAEAAPVPSRPEEPPE